MTAREFVLAAEAYEQKLEHEFEVTKWQTAHVMHACAGVMGKPRHSVQAILSSWKPQKDTPDGKRQKTPMDIAREKFYEQMRAEKDGIGTGTDSKISS